LLESIPIAILAGGLATRLRPVTETIPKSMVPVSGRPFLEHQVEYLRRQGLRRIVVCAGHLGEQIQHYFGDTLEYSFDGDKPLGTAGALRKALPLLGKEFFVIYGDSYLPTNFAEVSYKFASSGASAQMTVFRNHERNVWFEDGRVRAYDKVSPKPQMQHIDYGLSMFRAEAFNAVRGGDLATVFTDLAAAEKLAGFEVSERFYEIGSPAGLAEFRHDFQ
jgi:NDP-sugar pyrophosphorylase family protein